MKYVIDRYNDERGEWERAEITKEQAIAEIGKYYNNPEQCAELPCYYRTMFGGVEVVQD